ncbi:hypothetical protein JQ662_000229 [Listeria monocytogenes]|nr:hypothetical protein [Listeria monocytogenes]HAA4891980.1 hypothetical protein [Listeria monocytogenes]
MHLIQKAISKLNRKVNPQDYTPSFIDNSIRTALKHHIVRAVLTVDGLEAQVVPIGTIQKELVRKLAIELTPFVKFSDIYEHEFDRRKYIADLSVIKESEEIE